MACLEAIYAARTGAQDHANAGEVRSDLVDEVLAGQRTVDDAADEIVREIEAYASDTLDNYHCAECARAWAVAHKDAAVSSFRQDVDDAIARNNEDL